MRATPAEIPDVLEIELEVHRDPRGWFMETYRRDLLAPLGVGEAFVQDNVARSTRGVLRGLHFQRRPGQAKLVRVARGRVFDVAVDVRPGSPSFGRFVARELAEDDARVLYLPVGFAHGYQVLSELAEVSYKASAPYDPAEEVGIAWDDPDLAIPWPLVDPALSARDRAHPRLRDLDLGRRA